MCFTLIRWFSPFPFFFFILILAALLFLFIRTDLGRMRNITTLLCYDISFLTFLYAAVPNPLFEIELFFFLLDQNPSRRRRLDDGGKNKKKKI